MTALFALQSCEKSPIQKSSLPEDLVQLIEYRSSCEECPGIDECCCGVWVQNVMTGFAKIGLCGTSDGTDSCSGEEVGECPSFSGGGQFLNYKLPPQEGEGSV